MTVKRNHTAARSAAALMLLVCLLSALCPAEAMAESPVPAGGPLRVENGMMQPMLNYSFGRDWGYTNADSDILRFCVYVETDYDTDGDGMNDLVKAFVELPRAAAEGKYKAAVVYDPNPYTVGTVTACDEGAEALYVEQPFDYQKLYRKGAARNPGGEISTLEFAAHADPQTWDYMIPNSEELSYNIAETYDYFVIRGYALVVCSGIGTYGSEGFELCGMDLERDSHKAVVEWLTGDRRAFTDKSGATEIKADWSNGSVAMTGLSYGGTLPYEVATTGVKGLKTIIPYGGIASWYDYTNAQGVATRFDVHYADYLAAFNCGGTFLDDQMSVPNPAYGSWLWQIARDQEATNGDYGPIWAMSDYSDAYEKINCSALIVQGLNDFNVTSRQADLMMQAFERAGKTAKLVLHQNGHADLYGMMVNGDRWEDTVNIWLSHYLYGVENGIENMPSVLVQSNIDGSWRGYDKWNGFALSEIPALNLWGEEYSGVDTTNIAATANPYLESQDPLYTGDGGLNYYYTDLDEEMASMYWLDIPAGATICGTPEIHVKLSTYDTNLDGLMITAVLVDIPDDGQPFQAYLTDADYYNTVPTAVFGSYDMGGSYGLTESYELVPSATWNKAFTFGWTDLCNPGCGNKSSEYTSSADLEAGKYYDYTFYMLPTCYTVAPGHHVYLVITGWDPYRAFLDEDFMLDPYNPYLYSQFTYSFMVDNSAVKVMLPLA